MSSLLFRLDGEGGGASSLVPADDIGWLLPPLVLFTTQRHVYDVIVYGHASPGEARDKINASPRKARKRPNSKEI